MTDFLTSPADVPAETRDHHCWLSPADWRFRAAAFERPELRDPACFEDLRPFVLGDLGFDNHRWPMFVTPERWRDLERDAVGIVRLLLDVPRRVFGGDAAGLADFYRLYPPPIFDILMAEPSGIDVAVCRGDYLIRDSQLRILEVNASPNSGGWEIGELGSRLLDNELIRRFVEDEGLDVLPADPLERLMAHLIHSTRRHLTDGSVEVGGRLDLAMIYGERPPFALDTPFRRRVEEVYRRAAAAADLEGELRVAPMKSLGVRGGAVEVDGRRVHAVLEDSVRLPPPAYRAFKAGRLGLFNGPLEPVLSDKRNLALLSEQAESDLYTGEERELVRRTLPWTRIVRRGAVRWRDGSVELEKLLLGEPERWVLKPRAESGGRGVTFGDEETPDAWRQAVETALAAGDWVAQEREHPTPYVSLDAGAPEGERLRLHDTIFGLMVYGDALGGAMVRFQPAAVGGAVNAARSATPGAWLLVG